MRGEAGGPRGRGREGVWVDGQEPSSCLTAPLAARSSDSVLLSVLDRPCRLSPLPGFSHRKVKNMSLYNLDRFRFERKGKGAEQVSPSPPAACAEAPGTAAAVRAPGGEEEEGADDKRPGTPASDVTERAGESGVLHEGQWKSLMSRNEVIIFCYDVCHFGFCPLCLFYKCICLCERFTTISTKVSSFAAVYALIEHVHLQASR